MMTFYEDTDCWLGYSVEQGIVSVHTEIFSKWSVSKYKKYLGILASFLNYIDKDVIYSVCKTEKAKKFNELFGFEELYRTKEDYYIMRLYVRST